MRIISDQRDYYDCVQAYGQDRTLVYLRKPEEVHFKRGQWPFPTIYEGWWFGRLEVTQHIIGFCGKIYPMLEMHGYTRDSKQLSLKCLNIEDVDAFVEKHADRRQSDAYFGRGRIWRKRSRRHSEFSRFFEQCKKKQDSFREMFLEKHCPVFVATDSRKHGQIVYNALLRPYDFVKIFDPYSAFQEISMFMGSMAMPEKEMPIISDELKIHSRGFDKWSFRRRPGGK